MCDEMCLDPGIRKSVDVNFEFAKLKVRGIRKYRVHKVRETREKREKTSNFSIIFQRSLKNFRV